VKALSEGLIVANPVLLRHLLVRRQAGDSDKSLHTGENSLSPREVEVLQQLALGLTNKQIALALSISEHTVKFHISSIYSKLEVMNRADVVRTGIARGWITI
jgi:NarL family two-component system response regulator YdfI